MNIYFLLEGKRTEAKVYPAWLGHLVPNLKKVQWHHEAEKNNYCVFSGNGYPSLLDNHLRNSIEDVNDAGNFDYLVVCLDADDVSVDEIEDEVLSFVKKENIELIERTELVIIVQNKCIETWFLGNTKMFKRSPNSSKLMDYYDHYNVKDSDPELMLKPVNNIGSTSDFHFNYLRELLKERTVSYTKKNPKGVMEESYLYELIKRIKETGHLSSLKSFIDFCKDVDDKIVKYEVKEE